MAASFVGLGPSLRRMSVLDWQLFGGCYLLYVLLYFAFRHRTPGYKQAMEYAAIKQDNQAKKKEETGTIPRRSDGWIPSHVCSSVVSVISIYTFTDAVSHNFSVQWYESESFAARISVLHFFAFLVFELTVGAVAYASQLDMLSGWVHHVVYLWICLESIGHSCTNMFSICYLEEIPTMVLSIRRLDIYR